MTLTTKILLVLTLSTIIFAQKIPEDFVKNFFDDFQNEKGSTAVENLYSANPWIQRSKDAISNLKTQIDGLTEGFVGKFYGYDRITKKSVGENFILLTYLARFDRQPIRFSFHFYKPNDKWMIYSFSYDDDLNVELSEAAQILFLKD